MKLIPLTKGYFAQVDDDDFKSINQHKWFVQINHYKSRSVYYAARSIKNDNGKPGMLFMHQVILGGKKDGFVSDHIDFDGLNNRRSNLRYLTHRDNLIHSPSRTKPFIEKKPSVRQPYILQIKVDRKWRRQLSAGCVGTPNEMLFICEIDRSDDKKITDLICLHNYDYDGYLTETKIKTIIMAITGNTEFAPAAPPR